MQTAKKVIGADLAHRIAGSFASVFVIPLGLAADRPELQTLDDGETVVLDEGDASAEGIVFSEWHAGQQYWYARVDGTTWRDQP